MGHPKKFDADIEEVYDIAKENEVSFEFHEADTLKIEIPLCNASRGAASGTCIHFLHKALTLSVLGVIPNFWCHFQALDEGFLMVQLLLKSDEY